MSFTRNRFWIDVPVETWQLAYDDAAVSHLPLSYVCKLRIVSDIDCLMWMDMSASSTDTTKAFRIPKDTPMDAYSHADLAMYIHAIAANAGDSGTLYVTRMSDTGAV